MDRAIVRVVVGWATATALMWAAPAPGAAAMAAIETMTAVDDESDEAVKSALERAVQAAVRGAMAMGLPFVELRQARVLPGMVTVQVLAREQGAGPLEEEGEDPATEEAPDR